METLLNIITGRQPLDDSLLQEDAYLDLLHLLDMLLVFGVAFYAARKIYRKRMASKPPQQITRAEDNRDALLEAKQHFVLSVARAGDLFIGVICALVSLFVLGVVVWGAIDHGADWWQNLKDSAPILCIPAVFGPMAYFLLRRA